MFSLIETAKANGLEPYKYLRYVFEKLPTAVTTDDLRELLPCNVRRHWAEVDDVGAVT
jgi:hypothetical protein